MQIDMDMKLNTDFHNGWMKCPLSFFILLILFAGNYHALLGDYNELSHDTLLRRIHVSR